MFKTSEITIDQYNEKYRKSLEAFELDERQKIYSSLPLEVLDEGLMDPNRRPCVVLNDNEDVVGFFVLHQYYQHEGYDTPVNAVYVRSLSVNNKFQGNGYGTEIMMHIPEFVQTVFKDFDHLFLVVDAENQGAWNVYERAGFLHLATNPNGPIGKERLYYLDLDKNYVSLLRLVEGNDIDLVLDGKTIGHAGIREMGDTIEIVSLDIHENHDAVKENFIRQIATYVRKHYKAVKKIEVNVESNMDVYLKNNFVAMDESNKNRLTKLIRY
ncbi:GNAT family N-acetyltransferase [Macrococcus sp. DPC7161]|uniref:GNAT family N-acetyltransferase n=1 Tax=Macrococcus sp. DPC7161 TaxID=2507060 RepID=UPI00100AFE34|nr:GNAT family N-acetyltransferase [Macrococcus sp. DPC7161]RXK17580.1 GNAT family N-acetyltransferase [Macrococcus sp. DPC7161]